jgi:hypothetical protein
MYFLGSNMYHIVSVRRMNAAKALEMKQEEKNE